MSAVDLGGRVIIVSGGNGGIGLGLARGIVRAGGAVMIWGRNKAKNASAERDLMDLGGDVSSCVCDVSDEAQVDGAMQETLRRFPKIDGLIANAGKGGQSDFIDMTLNQWRAVMATNLEGTFLCLRAAARELVRQEAGGSLVAVSSTSAIHGAPGREHYSASKAGVLALMRGLAVELARHRIRCNSLIPGWTDTDMTSKLKGNARFMEATRGRTPLRRWATPDDFESVGAFLADPTVMFHTGDTLTVDGGYTVF